MKWKDTRWSSTFFWRQQLQLSCLYRLLGLIAYYIFISLLGLPGLPSKTLAESPGLRHNLSGEPRWQLSAGNGGMMLEKGTSPHKVLVCLQAQDSLLAPSHDYRRTPSLAYEYSRTRLCRSGR